MIRRLFILCILAIAAAVEGRADVLTVGGGGYASVEAAVRSARSGDTIQITSGDYVGNVVLDKTLTLEGTGEARIIGIGSGSVITVLADNCIIRGLDVRHSGGDLQAEDAGILLRSSGNVVERNVLRDVLFGIYLYHSARNIVRSNEIHGRSELETGERGAGLHLWNSPDNRLEANVITQTRDGMYIQSSPRNVIVGNSVSGLRYGLHFMNSDDNRFEGNVFYNNVAGAAIMYSQRIELRRNSFVHNRGFSSFGILFQDCRECVAEENLIANNATGIFLEALRDSVIRRNIIAENDVAAQVFSSSERNLFTENNFIGNISPLRMIGKSTSTAWSGDSGGNYWSDYAGYDLDGDSFGDVPHRIQNIFEYLEGNYPRMRIYLDSPAARSVVAAEQAFPIIEGSNQFDRRPLMRPVEIGPPPAVPKDGHRSSALFAVSLAALGLSYMGFRRGVRK